MDGRSDEGEENSSVEREILKCGRGEREGGGEGRGEREARRKGGEENGRRGEEKGRRGEERRGERGVQWSRGEREERPVEVTALVCNDLCVPIVAGEWRSDY